MNFARQFRPLVHLEPVRVYRNLRWRNDQPVYSVMQRRLVVGHTHDIWLTSARFVVSEAGRQRVLRTGVKNVHAFVVGFVTSTVPRSLEYRVWYNPREGAKFTALVDHKFCSIHSADLVHLGPEGVEAEALGVEQ